MKIPEPESVAPSSPGSTSWTYAHNTSHETITPTGSPQPSPRKAPPSAPKPRPTSTFTTFSTAPPSVRSNAGQVLTLRFSGEKGHPVHSRHFLKEFKIAMRDLGVVGDREKIEAFEDYLVVDSPAEAWYAGLCAGATVEEGEDEVMTWAVFQDRFMARFPPEGKFDPAAVELQKIRCVKFRQSGAVSAYIMVKWVEDIRAEERAPAPDGAGLKVGDAQQDTVKTVKLGGYKPIATEEIFSLSEYGVPEGAKIQFLSRAWGVGEYNSVEDVWFIHDPQSTKGADFRQSGTAFKGWFNYTGRYEV